MESPGMGARGGHEALFAETLKRKKRAIFAETLKRETLLEDITYKH